ncbi:Glutamine--tRNA ligase [compost metagenome]
MKGVIHWVSATHSLPAEIRLYDRLFKMPNPGAEDDFEAALNPDSLVIIAGARVEASLKDAKPEFAYQFEREGYFCADNKLSSPEHLVFNRTVALRDVWGKAEA